MEGVELRLRNTVEAPDHVYVREMYPGSRKLYSLSGCPKGILPAYILLKEEAFGVCTLLPRWTSAGNPPHKTKSFDVCAHLAV